jgi:hypothetical protein
LGLDQTFTISRFRANQSNTFDDERPSGLLAPRQWSRKFPQGMVTRPQYAIYVRVPALLPSRIAKIISDVEDRAEALMNIPRHGTLYQEGTAASCVVVERTTPQRAKKLVKPKGMAHRFAAHRHTP